MVSYHVGTVKLQLSTPLSGTEAAKECLFAYFNCVSILKTNCNKLEYSAMINALSNLMFSPLTGTTQVAEWNWNGCVDTQ
jgi:hypothetical protein